MVLLLAIFIGLGSVSNTAGGKVNCKPLSKCSCELDNNGGRFDLSVLHQVEGSPLFDIASSISSDVRYLYGPCYEFSYGNCKNVAGCKTNTSSSTQNTIALFKNLRFEYDDNDGPLLKLHYSLDSLVPPVKTTVILRCNTEQKEPTLEVQFENFDVEYSFILTSSICGPTLPNTSISFGTFLCITVPIILFSYFTFGFLYLFLVKHETWENAVPHHEFWFSLPGLIKDGFLFTWFFITGRPGDSGAGGYEQI